MIPHPKVLSPSPRILLASYGELVISESVYRLSETMRRSGVCVHRCCALRVAWDTGTHHLTVISLILYYLLQGLSDSSARVRATSTMLSMIRSSFRYNSQEGQKERRSNKPLNP